MILPRFHCSSQEETGQTDYSPRQRLNHQYTARVASSVSMRAHTHANAHTFATVHTQTFATVSVKTLSTFPTFQLKLVRFVDPKLVEMSDSQEWCLPSTPEPQILRAECVSCLIHVNLEILIPVECY